MDVQHRTAHCGSILSFNADPGTQEDSGGYEYWQRGVLIVADGQIEAVGPAAALLPGVSGNMPVVDHGERLIMPGFIDTHIHVDPSVFWAPRADPDQPGVVALAWSEG